MNQRHPPKGRTPFFVLGCVRSGTTFLRDVLRHHPALACPEETHFYRWSEPFGTPGNKKLLSENPVLKRHRHIDGIGEPEFAAMLAASSSRGDLCERYMRRFIEGTKPGATRWFDKTPQNVYGAPMIAADFPRSRFIHIVRNPLDVIASLRVGKVMKIPQLVGACNYWNEAAQIVSLLLRSYPRRVHELHYESLIADVNGEVAKILEFVGEEFDPAHYTRVVVKNTVYDHAEMFAPAELDTIRRLCGDWARHYRYDLGGGDQRAAAA